MRNETEHRVGRENSSVQRIVQRQQMIFQRFQNENQRARKSQNGTSNKPGQLALQIKKSIEDEQNAILQKIQSRRHQRLDSSSIAKEQAPKLSENHFKFRRQQCQPILDNDNKNSLPSPDSLSSLERKRKGISSRLVLPRRQSRRCLLDDSPALSHSRKDSFEKSQERLQEMSSKPTIYQKKAIYEMARRLRSEYSQQEAAAL